MHPGQLVVRYHSSKRKRVAVVGLVLATAAGFYIAYEWGRFDGGYSKFAEVQRTRELATRIEALERENDKLRAQTAAAELARDVDRRAYADVEKTLDELQAQVLKQSEELTFYRGIVSPEDGIGGLRIQRFQLTPGPAERRYRMRIVLVQSMRHDAFVSGLVSIVVEGAQQNRRVELNLAQLGGTRSDGQAAFKFRYFQNLEQEIELPESFEPRTVHVEVRSPRLAPVRESFPWQVQTEG
jgi:hypothetical protein